MKGDSFDALSERQIEALCNVAFGGYGAGIARRTLDSLEGRGLIERVIETSREGNVVFSISTWIMPVHVHIAFCEWCSASPLHFLDEIHR